MFKPVIVKYLLIKYQKTKLLEALALGPMFCLYRLEALALGLMFCLYWLEGQSLGPMFRSTTRSARSLTELVMRPYGALEV